MFYFFRRKRGGGNFSLQIVPVNAGTGLFIFEEIFRNPLNLFQRVVADSLLRPLETSFPAMPEFAAGTALPPSLAECRFVVVLGGGNHHTLDVAASNLLSTAALGRVVEGIRLLRLLPDAKLIVTGPGDPAQPTPSHATMLARAATLPG